MTVKDSYSLVIYGDSITKGVIFDEQRKRYVQLKESFSTLLQKDFKGVIHAVGKFGTTTIAAAERLYNLVIEKKPDLVLIEFGGNDCDFNWEEIAEAPMKEHRPKTDLNVFQAMLKKITTTVRESSAVPVLMTLPPLDAEKYFRWISKNDPLCAQNILLWLETISRIYWWHERYNSAIMSVAEETNTLLIDVRGAFLSEPDFRELISIDGIHPNEQGHKVIARKILDYARAHYSFLLGKS